MIVRFAAIGYVCSFLLWLVVGAPLDQVPLVADNVPSKVFLTSDGSRNRPLHGRFLHITDLHPDPFYLTSSSPDSSCHRGSGSAGPLGAEITSCDSPLSLLNATFAWIDQNLKNQIDFVVWTGDSARHDNDEKIPRTEQQIKDLNRFSVRKFVEVFGEKDKSDQEQQRRHQIPLSIPVVPTWGNNDILPHNIFHPGPNKWTRTFLDIWRPFIPEAQRHGFEYGGWFYNEVIPGKLAVISLNSLYFFDNNAAVDGCTDKSEPGYAQFEWLRIQLQFMREKDMKAIIIGHVPPARTEGKQAWDETCWQKYTLWTRQFRDVVVGSLWGHMNVDHFLLQDSEEVDIKMLQDDSKKREPRMWDEAMTVRSTKHYLAELRELWSELPEPPSGISFSETNEIDSSKKSKGKKEKFFEKIGGLFGERFSLSLVSPSVVPNYYPTLRIIEYNTSGIEYLPTPSTAVNLVGTVADDASLPDASNEQSGCAEMQKKKKKNKHKKPKKGKKGKKPKFQIPQPPSQSTPPGPAYSPQTFTWTGYTQLYANLTAINRNLESSPDADKANSTFNFEVEYSTSGNDIFHLPDLTVLSYLKLAERIGSYKPKASSPWAEDGDFSPLSLSVAEDDTAAAAESNVRQDEEARDETAEVAKKHKKDRKKKKKKKKKKKGKRKLANKAWAAFVRRAFVGSVDEEELRDEFGR